MIEIEIFQAYHNSWENRFLTGLSIYVCTYVYLLYIYINKISQKLILIAKKNDLELHFL